MKLNAYDLEAVEIIDLMSDGRGIAKIDQQVIFVKHAVPKDIVNIHVYKKAKKHLEAEVTKIVTPSPFRIQPECQHFGNCGGCKLQFMDYDAQLSFKQKQVEDAIFRIGKLQINDFQSILASEKQFFYRNKTEFSFSVFPWKTDKNAEDTTEPALGFHAPMFWDKVVDVQECLLHDAVVNEIRNAVKAYAIQNQISFYNPRTHQGFLRNLLFRTAMYKNQLMVALIHNDDMEQQLHGIINFIKTRFPQISSLVSIYNGKSNDSYSELPWTVHKGDGFIYEKLEEKIYRISPTSFFQTNSFQALRLYFKIKEWIPEKVNTIYDLYAGCGSIGIFLAEKANQIVGVEYVQSSVQDALHNCKINQLSHLQYFAGDMAKIMTSDFWDKNGKPDVIVTDPPRSGMDEKVVNRIIESNAPKVIYVSCNPCTQARDLNLLKDYYDVVEMIPVDMFPHTHHVENLALLIRKS